MLYDHASGKGCRRRCIPTPNPQKVELPRKSTLDDLYQHAKDLYFGEEANTNKMSLADSSGILVKIIDEADWVLESYYKDNDFKPSRHKVYVVYDGELVRLL